MLVRRPEGKAFPVMFLGDIQSTGFQSPQSKASLTVLKENVKRGMDCGAWFVGMGDFTDTFSPSNRARLAAAGLYDTATDTIDAKNLDLILELYNVALKPTKGRWLGLLAGHHWHQFKYGDTTDMRLASLLDAPFVGDCVAIRLKFQLGGSKQLSALIWAHHGVGNGQTGYYPLARLEKVAAGWEGVDVFAMGHTTKQAVEATNKLRTRWGHDATEGQFDLVSRKVVLVGSGGYSKAYVENAIQGQVPSGGYAEKRMLNPSVMGSPVVWFWPKRVMEGGVERLVLDVTGEA